MTGVRRFKTAIALSALLLAGGIAWVSHEWTSAFAPQGGRTVVEVPRGMGARELVRLLHERNLIRSEWATLAYIAYAGNRGSLKAGEYLFDRPLTIPEIVAKLARGSVHLHRFTVPEGLTVVETAAKWEEQGFGESTAFLDAAEDALTRVRTFDPAASTVEGYLLPETYFFPKGAAPRDAVAAMIGRFQAAVARLKASRPDAWPLDLRSTVILASLVETEAFADGDRPLISSVYVNRLKKKMLLQCDPTVIYAIGKDRLKKGRLTSADLKHPSPYNTYLHPGLPPSAIANPGYASLEAAVRPAATPYLYFVRGAGGKHVFSVTVAEHNRAVAAYRAMQAAGK
jgi:UPF0755 protein